MLISSGWRRSPARKSQHILPTNRVHGIIRDGGDVPNIVPSHMKTEWNVRRRPLPAQPVSPEADQSTDPASTEFRTVQLPEPMSTVPYTGTVRAPNELGWDDAEDSCGVIATQVTPRDSQ
jgi:hypothetical protein